VRGKDQESGQLICSCGVRFLVRRAVPEDSHPPALRIAIVADSHFDRRPNGRLTECVKVHDWIADDMDRRGVDLALLSGDLYEGESAPNDRNPAVRWVQWLAQSRPVVAIKGNHDRPGDLEILSRLESEHPIVVEERYGVHTVKAGAQSVGIACMAYPRKGWLLAGAEAKSHEQTSADAVEALRAVLRGMGTQMADLEGPRILLTHAMVRGSVTSTGQPLIGMDMEVGVDDLGLVGADVIALGHVHKHQAWTWNEKPIIYPGSPRRTKYGEREDKGYVVLYFDQPGVVIQGVQPRRAKLRDWAWIPTPAQRMIHAEEEWGPAGNGFGWHPQSGEGIELLADLEDEIPGADIRFRYHTTDHLRETATEAARSRKGLLLMAGAERVKVDPVIAPTVRKRSKEFSQARTLPQKLEALWVERELDLSDEQKERAFRKLELLEDEVPR
jgi:exonuclease SbcD